MSKRKHWYTRRLPKDAPGDVFDEAMTKEGAWARGYNDAIQAYLDEMREALRAEGIDVDGSEMSR